MKKLLVLAAVAAMAMGAKAELTSCKLGYVRFFPAAGDTSPAVENLTQNGYYQCYIIQHSGQQSIDDYVKANTMESIASQSITTFDYGYEDNEFDSGMYDIDGWAAENSDYGYIPVSDDLNLANAYAVVYYLGGEETPSEYVALPNISLYMDDLVFKDKNNNWQTYGAPTPAPVPEPTSGLLLLLGVAGLALKRRRV